jgi:monofunctional glycosyltransferase
MKRPLAIGLLIFLTVALYVAYVVLTMPDVQSLKTKNPTMTAIIEQRAREKNTTPKPIRTWVSYKNISPHLRNAVLIAEDSSFFQHSGYDIEEIKESLKRNWREKRFARGASTITQQLAKNLYLSTSKNPLRKIQEMEKELSKQRIFEVYLNVIEWGDATYGIESASQRYFGKPASTLLPEEAAVLAAMIPNPRRYTPSRNQRYLERRKREILSRLNRYSYLPKDEYQAALARPLMFR